VAWRRYRLCWRPRLRYRVQAHAASRRCQWAARNRVGRLLRGRAAGKPRREDWFSTLRARSMARHSLAGIYRLGRNKAAPGGGISFASCLRRVTVATRYVIRGRIAISLRRHYIRSMSRPGTAEQPDQLFFCGCLHSKNRSDLRIH
jgi:hypothetical protein